MSEKVTGKDPAAIKLAKALIRWDAEKIKGYPKDMYAQIVNKLTDGDNSIERVAIATSEFKKVEQMQTVANFLGTEKAIEFGDSLRKGK
jgi:hypothetical protein